ncbi:dolichyl-phosphate-mannose--protein mannosyltransferase [Lusitaniella coriacea]|uniref:dolichyl-phosphate-mannose--protein mannosyltransferase n=1 Tax=Lusitaniella coriacea TaxID=1983105 RepID=UPI003CF9DC17
MDSEPSTPLKQQLAKLNIPWFWVGIAALFAFSLALRFWGLSRFNTLVFDETIYVNQSNSYLTHTFFFSDHPPISKYLIALGIWIDTHNPLKSHSGNYPLAVSELNAYSYRWMNALVGSFVPLLIAGIAYQLSRRRSYALLAGLFAGVDGFLLVESRYALNNISIIFFGLLGQWLFLFALNSRIRQRRLYLLFSGISFGFCIASKWNGLGFLLGIYLVWGIAWVLKWARSLGLNLRASAIQNNRFLKKLTRLSWLDLACDLGFIPILVYCLLWIPHFLQNPSPGFLSLHQQSLSFHKTVGGGTDVHPYCSRWYTWPLMLRPVAYYFDRVTQDSKEINYVVQGTGNPVLWWLSTAAILIVLWGLIRSLRRRKTSRTVPNSAIVALAIAFYRRTQRGIAAQLSQLSSESSLNPASTQNFFIPLYLVANYAANLLPWVKVTRCTFLYHYLSASIFSFLALAWIVDRGLRSSDLFFRILSIAATVLVLSAFIFWLPIFLGLPLSREAFDTRMLLQSWY